MKRPSSFSKSQASVLTEWSSLSPGEPCLSRVTELTWKPPGGILLDTERWLICVLKAKLSRSCQSKVQGYLYRNDTNSWSLSSTRKSYHWVTIFLLVKICTLTSLTFSPFSSSFYVTSEFTVLFFLCFKLTFLFTMGIGE